MYESILTIKKILSGEHFLFKNVRRVTVRYRGKVYTFDKDRIVGLFGVKSIPVEFLNSSTEVFIGSLDFEDKEENNED